LLLICQWADLHASDPRRGPIQRRTWNGEDRLVEVGGDGTPLVRELSIPELSIARQVHTLSTRAAVADALDLRHRLPRTWQVVLAGDCEPWVARKVAALSRALDRTTVHVVDDAVADAIAGESPARVLELARAKVIEADPATHAARLEAELRRRYVGASRIDEHGLRNLYARLEAGPAEFVLALIDQITEALDQRRDLVPHLPDDAGRDEIRAEAFGWLAHPDQVLDLLEPSETPEDGKRNRRRHSSAVVYVHLHEAALHHWGVARVEDLGPLLLDQVIRMLGHAHVTLKPVLDLSDTLRVNAYEHPESVKERIHLRTVGDVFPHATRVSRHVDMDHPRDYREDGPDGQTGDHNAAPLARTHHRAKTHLPYLLRQLGPDDYVWRTPHGLWRHITHTGTHRITLDEANALIRTAELHRVLDELDRQDGKAS
ncbi:MAG TPA: hypothetical protein VFT70_14200, partial [Nocardioides sp.]|nr:hypothetical protein [Nocardioides sp.]